MDKGYTLLSNTIWEDENLSHTEFRVYTFLIRTYNKQLGYSFPSRNTILAKCHLSQKTLNTVLNDLEGKGYITRHKKNSSSGWNNIYYLHKHIKNTPSEPMRQVVNNNPTNYSSNNAKYNTGANKKPLTKYHNTFNEHYKKYDYDELEKKLLKSQEEKRNAAVKAFREKIG